MALTAAATTKSTSRLPDPGPDAIPAKYRGCAADGCNASFTADVKYCPDHNYLNKPPGVFDSIPRTATPLTGATTVCLREPLILQSLFRGSSGTTPFQPRSQQDKALEFYRDALGIYIYAPKKGAVAEEVHFAAWGNVAYVSWRAE